MNHLPPNFAFSQSSLQDYADCQRRFQLRHVMKQPWPAVEADPVLDQERYLQQGKTFHSMVQQFLMGFPAEKLLRPTVNTELVGWWENFRASGLHQLPAQRHPELQLSTLLNGFPLTARYDLIAIEPQQQAVIVDWKTAHTRPSRRNLERRIQTRLYRYLLVKAGAYLNGGQALLPEQITMRYWFANFPDQPENLPYSTAQMVEDEAFLAALMGRIHAQTDEVFPLTDDLKRCSFCTYRTLCERGERAGQFGAGYEEDDTEPPILELDF